jgi:hypothetical protein
VMHFVPIKPPLCICQCQLRYAILCSHSFIAPGEMPDALVIAFARGPRGDIY